MNKALIAILTVAYCGFAAAQMTPVGLWKTIDFDGKTAKSLVRISETNGVLVGKIEKILDPAKVNNKCTQCTDERKNQPYVGLTIIRNARRDAQDEALWTGGDVLDPKRGKTYKTRLRPVEGGKALEVRAYVSLIYRTQIWQRVENIL